MFTAFAIAQFAEQGKLAFHDPVSTHLPEYPREIAEKVTIHHLLTHTSGMCLYWASERFWQEWFLAIKDNLRTVDDFLPFFRDEPLAFEPGEKFQYSNAGYVLLGAIIERVSGQEYWTYMREHIFEPAGMYHTDAYEIYDPPPHQATGYTRLSGDLKKSLKLEREEGPRKTNLDTMFARGNPAGYGFSTVEDLFKFSLAVRSHLLLSPTFTISLFTGKVERSGKPGVTYAYGWEKRMLNGHEVVGHGGAGRGASAHFDLYLDLGYTVVVLSNYDPPIAPRLANDLRMQLTILG